MMKKWGILGTGAIARVFAEGLRLSTTGYLAAVASRSEEKAVDFAQKFDVGKAYSSYESLLCDPEIDIVYIALPHPLHAEWTIRASNHGKHVLCEKPMAMNAAQAIGVINAVKSNSTFFMEGFMYRFHPQTRHLINLINKRVIGEIRIIQAAFSFHADYTPAQKCFNHSMGGGGIMDVGCYPLSMARMLAGAEAGKVFEEPVEVHGVAHVGVNSRVDEWTVGCFKFPNGILAQLSAGVHLVQENILRIFGSEGSIVVPSPWLPGGREPGITKIMIHERKSGKTIEELITSSRHLYTREADTVAENLDNKQSPLMSWEDSVGNMKAMDLWRQSVGVRYDIDQIYS